MKDEPGGGVSRRGAGRKAKLITVGASLVFALLIAEAALRAVGYSYPVFYRPDPELGYALKPGAEGWYRKEGGAYVRVNSDGLRDRERERAKPPGVVRVAVLGDSYAEALQVAEREAFWAVMEDRLRDCGRFAGRRVEVINFGVSGYGTAQELIALRRKAWDYSPDVVLLALTTNNDITDNSRALKKTDEVPYFVRRGGRLVADESFRAAKSFRLRSSWLNRLGTGLRDRSRVIQLLHEAHGALKSRLRAMRSAPRQAGEGNNARAPAEGGAAAAAAPAPAEEVGIDNMIYREPADEVWHEAWAVTEELLSAMRDEVRARGAEFVVATLSNGIQVYPDARARESFLRRVGASDLFYPDRRVKAIGEREGFKVVNLAPALQRYADEHKAFLHGFGEGLGNGHWNALGHRVAGELLARELCAAGAGGGKD